MGHIRWADVSATAVHVNRNPQDLYFCELPGHICHELGYSFGIYGLY